MRLLKMAGTALLVMTLAGACTVATPRPQTGSSPATAGTPGAFSPVPASSPPSGTSPVQLQDAFRSVVKSVRPSVVQIETDLGLGSGVIFDAQGDIVTNFHVVDRATSFRVTLNGSRPGPYDGKLVGTFSANDLAVIRISAPSVQPAQFADSSKVQVGDIVMAIGNPLGLSSSVTEGIVSATGRIEPEPGGATLPDLIQTSASINPGNSGGALVDLNGLVVGIPTLAATDPELGGSAPGIGFAIASNTARDVANQLVQYGKVVNTHRAYLGVRVGDVNGGGVYVSQVVAGGPADQAGIKTGDIITDIAGQPTPDSGSLTSVLAGLQPGQKVKVDMILPDGTHTSVQVTLGQLSG